MGKFDLALNIARRAANYTKICGKTSVLQTKPVNIKNINFSKLKPSFTKTDSFVKNTDLLSESKIFGQIKEKLTKHAPSDMHEKIFGRYRAFVNNKDDLNTVESLYTAAEKELAGLSEKNFIQRYNHYFVNIKTLKDNRPEDYKILVDGGFFDLVREGKISLYNFKTNMQNARVSRSLLEDLKKAANKEEFVPDLSRLSIAELQTAVKNGEVFMQNNKLFTKNNGIITNINLTKEKYLELFPPVLRHVSNQAFNLGNCWIAGRMDNLISKESGAGGIYSLFRQEGDNIFVKFPNCTKEILFPKGKALVSSNSKTMTTVPGLAMLEQSLAVHIGSKYSNRAVTDISKFSKNVDGLMNNLAADSIYYSIKRIINGNFKIEPLDLISKEYTSPIRKYSADNKYTVHSLFNKFFGIWDVTTPKAQAKNTAAMERIIKEQANLDNLALNIGVQKNTPQEFRELYNMIPNHELTLKEFSDGKCWISNPWYNWIEKGVDLPVLMKYLQDMQVPYKWT